MMKKSFVFVVLASLFILNACDKDDDNEQMVDLPSIVQQFVDTNYPNHEMEESALDTLCTGEEVYEIELEGSNDEEFEIAVTSEGALLFTEFEISTTELPAEVTTSLSTNYADYTIEEAVRLDMADGSARYEAEIKNGSSQLEILMESDGTVVCEEEDNDD